MRQEISVVSLCLGGLCYSSPSRLFQKHSKMKDGEKKEDVFRMVQMSSGVDEPQDKGRYTEVGEGLRRFRKSVCTG